MTRRDIPR